MLDHVREQLLVQAQENLIAAGQNRYPGRLLVIGVDETGQRLIQILGITVRSAPNQNRVLTRGTDGRVFTEFADPSQVTGNPELLLYDAMLERKDVYIVGNGKHTGPLLADVGSIIDWTYEKDSSSTPRIFAAYQCQNDREPHFVVGILRKSLFDDSCDRDLLTCESVGPGFGWLISTYDKDGNPPPSFSRRPILMPLRGTIDEIMTTYWYILDPEYRVALAVKSAPLDGNGPSNVCTMNKKRRVQAPQA